MKTLLLTILCFSTQIIFAQENHVIHRIFFTANLVDITNIKVFNERVESILASNSDPFTFIINGDIATGNEEEGIKNVDRPIRIFLEHFQDINGKIIVIPGDRDWDNSGERGWKEVKKFEKYIKSLKLKNVEWAVKDGCPGPKTFEIGDHLVLITLNTQWWNHPYDKPKPSDGDCKISTTDDFKEELEDIINDNPTKNILIAGHFPVISYGEYGGHFPFYKHIFPLTDLANWLFIPLPFVGSFYPAYRESIGTVKDIGNERYEEVKELLGNIITQYRSLIYLSGHEKNQQIIELDGNYFINSGAPESADFSGSGEGTVLSEKKPGIIEIVYYSNGKVVTKLHKFDEDDADDTIEQTILVSACDDVTEDIPLNFCLCPCRDLKPPKEKMARKYSEIVNVIAGPEYDAGSLKRFFFGDHYRDDWTAEIEVPYLDLDTTFGGLTVLKRGGGRQTKSLKFMGANGIRYTFRSVNKDPVKALDYDLRQTVIAKIVRDQTTTQHPYGAMAADILLNELDIIHAHPKLYKLPDDPKLGPFQLDFGGMLGMLEENPSNPEKGEIGYKGATEILRTHKLIRKLYNDHNYKIDTKNFAIARSFDILVGDWGKHDDNWKWVGYKTGTKMVYKPMPRDRDHVFSRWDGLLPWLVDREWAKESGENFDYEISGLRSLMFQARHLDRFIAANLSKKDWLNAAHFIQERINDGVIEQAVRNMPEETYELSGRIIEDKFKSRIKDLDKYVLEYYEMIAPEVDIVGSNKREYFDINRNTEGSVDVNVYDVIEDDKKGMDLIYSRTFYQDETNDIRLYGLGEKDIFNVSGNTEESIKVRIIGGQGADVIIDESTGSSAPTLVYEKSKKVKIKEGENTKIVTPHNEELYDYNRTSFAYNTYFPLPYFYFNADDGFILSLGVDFVNHSFEKKDYNSKHNIRLTGSTGGSFTANYSVRFHHVLGNVDLLLNGHFANPVSYTFFYGFGNETIKDHDRDYYKTRYKSKGVSAGLAFDFWRQSSLTLNVSYENNEPAIDTSGTIFGTSDFFGTSKVNLVEASLDFDLDYRNHPRFPTSGTRFFASYKNGLITSNDNSNYGQLLAHASGFLSFRILLPFTFGVRVGGGNSYGEIPFYKHLSLGQNTFLKGYRNNRFTGESMLFLQSALRINLRGLDGAPVPLQVGLLGFFNTGRIFQSNETLNKWHNGYGFGIFIIPFRKDFTISTTFGFSDEESLLFEFGLGGAL
ncbi:hypothetical protein ACFLS9_03605 [Bacteroidota bacterium]